MAWSARRSGWSRCSTGAVAVVVVDRLFSLRVVTPEAARVAQEEADRAERELAGTTAAPP